MSFFSHSNQLAQHQVAIEQHWQSCQQGYFNATHGKLFYTYHIPRAAKYSIILVNGRIESAWKYQELFWELAKNNIAVFSYDHIGQGLSPRLVANSHIGFVPKFSDYAQDLHYFIEQIVKPNRVGENVILGHSMGAAISYDYLAHYSHDINGAFLSAPMFDILTHSIPYSAAKGIAYIGCAFGLGKRYALGQTDYSPAAFSHNMLTQCAIRYQRFRTLYQNEPELQLGGVSYNWLSQVFQFINRVKTLKVSTPIQIASAQNDTIVNNQAQRDIAQQNHNVTLRSYAGARHELLCEKDVIRQAVLSHMYQFYETLLFTAKDTGS